MTTLLPNIVADMLDATFWTQRLSPSTHSSWSLATCNETLRGHAEILDMTALATHCQALPDDNARLRELIQAREPDTRTLYDEAGALWDETIWAEVALNIDWTGLGLKAEPGFTVRRANLRRWPTWRKAFRTESDREFDQFQETALHTFEPVLLLGTSVDGAWTYVCAATYTGWVSTLDIAQTTWDKFALFGRPESFTHGFLLVMSNTVFTEVQPYDAAVSYQHAEFAAYLPLDEDQASPVGNQSAVGHWRVLWPVRTEEGELELRPALMRRGPSVRKGYLPFNRASVVEMAFQLLGERYGWGDSFGCHDCSSTVMDAYRCIGVQLPRDAGPQEHALPVGHSRRVTFAQGMSRSDRQVLLDTLLPGDPLYMPGHTMIYLGAVDGRHFMIHDFAGYAQPVIEATDSDVGADVGAEQRSAADGLLSKSDEVISIQVNEVMVSTLDILTRVGHSYLDALTGALRLL